MTKALLKKQLMESFSWIYFRKKDGKRRTSAGIFWHIVLYALMFILLGVAFYNVAKMVGKPLAMFGLDWLYIIVMGLIAVTVGVLGSAFTTYGAIYRAQDNQMLLTMPIPPQKILLMRLSGVYLMGLLYELVVMVPALMVWFDLEARSIWAMVFSFVIPVGLSLLTLALSCLVGWVVALIVGHLPNKVIGQLLLALCGWLVYRFVIQNAGAMLNGLLDNADAIAEKVKIFLFPLYHMGRAATGDFLSAGIFVIFVAIVSGVVYWLLSASFFKLITLNKGHRKAVYRERLARQKSPMGALLWKEGKRFISSGAYMLNCGLGIVILVLISVYFLSDIAKLRELLDFLFGGYEQLVLLIFFALIAFVTAMVSISAPSVSLEGKNLWMMKVLPVSAWQVICSKLQFHVLLTLPAVFLASLGVLLVMRPGIWASLLCVVALFAFACMEAMLGLALNLLSPNFNWTSETVPVKHAVSVMVSRFGGWGVIVGAVILYARLKLSLLPFLGLISGSLVLVDLLLCLWLRGFGTRLFKKI